MNKSKSVAQKFTTVISKIDGIYSQYAKKYGMSESELCLLYALNSERELSQRQICDEWVIPKTTLNTITKRYEKEGYIEFHALPNNRKEMLIFLTETGKEYAKQSLAFIYSAETLAMSRVLEKFDDEFVRACECFADELRKAFEEQTDTKKFKDKK